MLWNLAEQLIAHVGSNEAVYCTNVQLDEQDIKTVGETLALKADLTLAADVLRVRRKVWEWVLEPVLAAQQQVKVLNADPNKVREGALREGRCWKRKGRARYRLV